MIDLYTAIIIITIMILVITSVDIYENPLINKDVKIYGIIGCILIGSSAIGECIGVWTNGSDIKYLTLHNLAKLMEFCLAPYIGVVVAKAYGKTTYHKVALTLANIHAIFEMVALCFGWVFSVDSMNIYHRESLYFVYVIAFISSIIYCILCIVQHSKEYQYGFDIILLLIIILMIIGIGIQFITSGIRTDFLTISIVNLLFLNGHNKMILQVDAVTKLLNRRCYDVVVNDLNKDVVIILFDINNFKAVNDNYGHAIGDVCLKRFATILNTVFNRYGQCYRIGGDEFCVILYQQMNQIDHFIEQINNEIKKIQLIDDKMPDVAYGYAYYYASRSHIQNVVKEADQMLYRNKSN